MSKLVIMRGLPGCGKSTKAKELLDQLTAKGEKAMIVERDAIRFMNGFGKYAGEFESVITTQQHALIRDGLKKGFTVISPDTNLNAKFLKGLGKIAVHFGADVEVIDIDTPLDECIRRDALREGVHAVGEKVIRDFHKRYLSKGFPPNPLTDLPAGVKLDPYKRDTAKPKAKIYDVDGTLMNHEGKRSPYDYTMVHLDTPHNDVVQQMRDDYALGYDIIVLSGREDSCRQATEESLRLHTQLPVGYQIPVFMRKTGDERADFIIKYEIFMAEIAKNYNVVGLYDDRNQVVDMWREIGLRCYQVAPGNF